MRGKPTDDDEGEGLGFEGREAECGRRREGVYMFGFLWVNYIIALQHSFIYFSFLNPTLKQIR